MLVTKETRLDAIDVDDAKAVRPLPGRRNHLRGNVDENHPAAMRCCREGECAAAAAEVDERAVDRQPVPAEQGDVIGRIEGGLAVIRCDVVGVEVLVSSERDLVRQHRRPVHGRDSTAVCGSRLLAAQIEFEPRRDHAQLAQGA
jgi:hypothetical protein